jgi:hypothetical protein
MTGTKPLHTRTLKKRAQELHDQVVVVETASHGKVEGICDGLTVTRRGKPESLSLATHKSDFGGGVMSMGFSVNADDILDIYLRPYPMYRFPEDQRMTYHRAAFALPEDGSQQVAAELLQAVDETFYQVSAELSAVGGRFKKYDPAFAPVELVISQSEQTSRSHQGYGGIDGWRYRVAGYVKDHGYDARRAAEAIAEVANGKPAVGLVIDNLDLSPRRDDLRNDAAAQRYLLDLLAEHAGLGYFGTASFSNHSYYEAHTEGRVEEIIFHLDPWEERTSGEDSFDIRREVGKLPPAIELMWDPELGGAPEHLEAILVVIRKHKLEQLRPLLTWKSSWSSGWKATPTEWHI